MAVDPYDIELLQQNLDSLSPWMVKTINALILDHGALTERVAKLEHRLEIDRVYVLKEDATEAELEGPIDKAVVERVVPPGERDKQYDGIFCRDETIKLLEADIEELQAQLAIAEARGFLARDT